MIGRLLTIYVWQTACSCSCKHLADGNIGVIENKQKLQPLKHLSGPTGANVLFMSE